MFKKLNLHKVLTELNTDWDEAIVKEFYANLETKNAEPWRNDDGIQSIVNGTPVKITGAAINTWFGITAGWTSYSFKRNRFHVSSAHYTLPDLDEFAANLGTHVMVQDRGGEIHERYIARELLPVELYVATEVIARNIFPRKGNLTRLRNYDAFLLAQLHSTEPSVDWFDYGKAVVQAIWTTRTTNLGVKTLPFPILICHFIRKAGVAVANPTSLRPVLNLEHFLHYHKKHFVCVNGVYYNQTRETELGQWKNGRPITQDEEEAREMESGGASAARGTMRTRRGNQSEAGTSAQPPPQQAPESYSNKDVVDYLDYINSRIDYNRELAEYNMCTRFRNFYNDRDSGNNYEFSVPPFPIEPTNYPSFFNIHMPTPPPREEEEEGNEDEYEDGAEDEEEEEGNEDEYEDGAEDEEEEEGNEDDE